MVEFAHFLVVSAFVTPERRRSSAQLTHSCVNHGAYCLNTLFKGIKAAVVETQESHPHSFSHFTSAQRRPIYGAAMLEKHLAKC